MFNKGSAGRKPGKFIFMLLSLVNFGFLYLIVLTNFFWSDIWISDYTMRLVWSISLIRIFLGFAFTIFAFAHEPRKLG